MLTQKKHFKTIDEYVTARFPTGRPIPYDLVKQIVIFRMKENQERKKK
jgi:uncharacterized protein YdhG (YjbR/CyaY superfamily)